jgi:hypothetical protein
VGERKAVGEVETSLFGGRGRNATVLKGFQAPAVSPFDGTVTKIPLPVEW